MNYPKPALTFAQQSVLLQTRGLVAPNLAAIEDRLREVSYYRPSAYWHPFKQPDETLKSGATLDKVWERYVFDRSLWLLVMDAIEHVEVAVLRTSMVESFTVLYGPFGHRQWRSFNPAFKPADHTRLMLDLDQSAVRLRQLLVEYPEVPLLSMGFPTGWESCPLWT